MSKAEETLLAIHTGSNKSCVVPPKSRELKSKRLSIIVPAYNEEQHIRRCLDSILTQGSDYIEKVIVVDDGSTDKTADILKEYGDSITIITQKNQGLSAARNAGLDILDTEYLMFVDSDDCLSPGTVEPLMRKALQTEADVVECDYDRTDEEGNRLSHHLAPTPLVWGKIIRADLFEEIRFPVGYLHEDGIWTTLIKPRIKNLQVVRHTGYYYTINPKSITSTEQGDSRMLDIYWMCKIENEDRLKLGIKDTVEFYEECLDDVIRIVKQTRELPECDAYIAAMYHQMNNPRFCHFNATTWRMRLIEKPLRKGQIEQVKLAATLL